VKGRLDVTEFDELVSVGGVVMAGRFGPDGRIAEHKGAGLLVENPQTLQMAQWFCAAISAMFNSMALAVDTVSHGGGFDTTSWLPLKGWAFAGGDYSIVVDGDLFVIAETARIKDFEELRRLLRAGTR
jgi:roadblock/LC7 domain-containing protein